MNIESLVCIQLESTYSSFMELIDFVLRVPVLVFETLLSSINKIYEFVYKTLKSIFDSLEKRVQDYLSILDPYFKLGGEINETLLACEPLFYGYVGGVEIEDPVTGEMITAYEFFKRYVLTNGVSGLVTKTRNLLEQKIREDIDELMKNEEYSLGWVEKELNILIGEYENFLRSPIDSYCSTFSITFDSLFPWAERGAEFFSKEANIFDLIRFMNKFANCAFSACNLSASIKNRICDLENKIGISAASESYVPGEKESEMINTKYKVEEFISKLDLNL